MLNHIRVTDDEAFQRKALTKDIDQMPARMVLRELAQHAIDATQAGICQSAEVKFMGVMYEGYHRMAVFNDAPGMCEDKLVKFATELRWSSREDKPDEADGNFGWGVRSVSMKASPLGAVFYNIHEGKVHRVKFFRDEHGAPMSEGPDEATLPPAILKKIKRTPKEGVVAILLGEVGREDTYRSPFPSGATSRIFNFVGQRYWTTGKVAISLTADMKRANNSPDLIGLGDWLASQEKRKANGYDCQLRENVIRYREGDIEVTIFKAHREKHGKEKSEMQVGAGDFKPGGGVVHGDEIYRWISKQTYARTCSYFNLATVADLVSVIVTVHDKDMMRVTSDRQDIQFVDAHEFEEGNTIKPDESAALRHFAPIIRNAIKTPQAKWLRDMREDRRKSGRKEDDIEARMYIHNLAKELNLLNKDGLKIDDDGNIIVDEDGVNVKPRPGHNPDPKPAKPKKPRPRPVPHPNPDGNRRASKANHLTIREFDVDQSDQMQKEDAFEWMNWSDPESTALLNYNPEFELFAKIRGLLTKRHHDQVKGSDLDEFFHDAMVASLKRLCAPTFVMCRFRMANGDMQHADTEKVERMWGTEGANSMLSIWHDLQGEVIDDVAKVVKAHLQLVAAE